MKRKTGGIVFFLVLFAIGFYGSVHAEVVDRIVAIVDTDIITQVQLNRALTPYMKQIDAAGYSDEKREETVKMVRENVLNSLIERSLTQQEAERYNISVSEAEIDGAVENVKQTRSFGDDELKAALAKEGLTLEEFRKDIKKQILRARLINHTVKSKVVISKAETKKYYEEHKSKYTGIRKYHIRNILMDSEAKINEVKRLLDEKESDFITLAKTRSEAPNASEGGDLGLFDISGFPDMIKEAVSSLKKGEYTGVIFTARGYQIFYVQDIVMDGGKTVEQAYDEIHGILFKEQVEIKFKDWLKSLKEKAHIKTML